MKTIQDGFREFEDQLTTPKQESLSARQHRASIEACLKQNFGLEGFFQSGSFGNGTNIPVHSDVDRFAVIPAENLPKHSVQALRNIRNALAKRFRTTAGIRIKPPAIVIPFGIEGLETTEIIPAYVAATRAGHKVYAIPNPAGGPKWILSAPQALTDYINDVNAKNNHKLKPLIRFVKAWKYQRKVPLQSLYIELVCAAMARDIGLHTPSVDIARILNFILMTRLADAHDPFGISDPICASPRPSDRDEAQRKLQAGAVMAMRAVTAELQWRLRPAFRCWKTLFGQRFPNSD